LLPEDRPVNLQDLDPFSVWKAASMDSKQSPPRSIT
jgi:hypothetical protein